LKMPLAAALIALFAIGPLALPAAEAATPLAVEAVAVRQAPHGRHRRSYRQPGVRRAYPPPAARRASRLAGSRRAYRSPALRRASHQPVIRRAYRSPALRRASHQPRIWRAYRSPAVRRAYQSPAGRRPGPVRAWRGRASAPRPAYAARPLVVAHAPRRALTDGDLQLPLGPALPAGRPGGARPAPRPAATPVARPPATPRPAASLVAREPATPHPAATGVARTPATPHPAATGVARTPATPHPTATGVARTPATPHPAGSAGGRTSATTPAPVPRRTPDAAGAQALAQALGLPAAALARVAGHAQLLAAPTPDAARAVAAAEATRAALFDALAPRLAGASAGDRQQAQDLLKALAEALPGVAVRLPADADAPPEAGVDYAALARALPPGAPGQALLAVAGVLRSPFGQPGYLRGGCADFGRVSAALARLPGAWQASPPALRARLQAPLRDAVVRMGEQADFCPDERRARQAAREAARLLGRLPAFGGPGTGKRIGHNFRSYGLKFGLAPDSQP